MKDEILLYGVHPVEEALRAGRRAFDRIFLSNNRSFSGSVRDIETRAASKNIPVERVSDSQLSRWVNGSRHQGVAARVGRLPTVTLSSLISDKRSASYGRLLVLLDRIVDPHNLGAIIRTALSVGAEAVVIPQNRAVGPSPAVSKASAGALEHICLVEVANLVRAILALKRGGWWVYGMDQGAGHSVYNTDLTGMVAMVVGGEERGIRPLVKQNCDFLLAIPQQGRVTSLNASVAAAVAMYEIYRQRLVADGSLSTIDRRDRRQNPV